MSVEPNHPSKQNRISVSNLDNRYLALARRLIASDQLIGDDGSHVLGITSSLEGEGTSTVATNLALTLAGLNVGPVLLVDANDLKPNLHRLFDMSGEIGFRNALAGDLSPLECVTPSHVERLSLALNGELKNGADAIYSSSSIDESLVDWRDTFSWIILDMPPVSKLTASNLLVSRMDGVLLVVEAQRIDRGIAERSVMRLRRTGANVLGAVYNKDSNTVW